MNWQKVFLVVEVGSDGLEIIEREGSMIGERWGGGSWQVNMRGSGCSSKMIEVVDGIYVHTDRDSAERHLKNLIKKRGEQGSTERRTGK